MILLEGCNQVVGRWVIVEDRVHLICIIEVAVGLQSRKLLLFLVIEAIQLRFLHFLGSGSAQ